MDLIGKKFGKLVVVKYSKKNKHGQSMFECACECGNISLVLGGDLKNGHTKSCGCLMRLSLVGQRFGRLTIIKRVDNNKRENTVWECLCDCGKITMVTGTNLKKGISTSCGCYRKERSKNSTSLKLEGMKFGKLTVLEKINKTKGSSIFRCICDCGNYVNVKGTHLKNGNTQSCGCYAREMASKKNFVNIEGQLFGDLKAVEPVGKNKHGTYIWKCLCSCGRYIDVSGLSLRRGKTKSCGCLVESWVAKETKKYFSEKYGAITEYQECINPMTGHFLPYDIYIPNGIYIEIQGPQHYEKNHFLQDFENRKSLDKVKKKHAQENGIFIEVDIRKYNTPEKAIKYIKSELGE